MSPRFIRPHPASEVRISTELQEFLDSCKDEWLMTKIESAFTELKADYEIGTKVTRDKWPRYYIKRWGVNNLYVHRIARDWRLTYALESDARGVAVFCLEVLYHREYDKRFGYRTS